VDLYNQTFPLKCLKHRKINFKNHNNAMVFSEGPYNTIWQFEYGNQIVNIQNSI